MAARCPECGGATEYVHDALSHLCISCGIMSDATQYILANESADIIWEEPGRSYYNGSKAVYGLHDKETRDRRNKVATHASIRSLLNQLSYRGLQERVESLFDASMEKGGFRWGQYATRIIGACTFIALRENSKPETLQQIAALARVEPSKLATALFRILHLHNLQLTTADPLNQVPAALAYLSKLTDGTEQVDVNYLPQDLMRFLRSASLCSVRNLAANLYHLTNRVFLTHNRSTGPVACALVILAFEAEVAKEIPSFTLLAGMLAQEFGTSKKTVVDRYNEMLVLLVEMREVLPWSSQAPKKARKGSVAQRAQVAKFIKDVVEFQEELEQEHICGQGGVDGAALGIDEELEVGGTLNFRPNLAPTHIKVSSPIVPGSTDPGHCEDPAEKRHSKRQRLVVSENASLARNSPSSVVPLPNPEAANSLYSRSWTNLGCARPHYAQLPTRRTRHQNALEQAASSLVAGPVTSNVENPKLARWAPALNETVDSSMRTFRAHLLSSGVNIGAGKVDDVDAQFAGRTESRSVGAKTLYDRPLPTRLELLAALKGEENISDGELFLPGELEALMKDDREVEIMRERARQEGWDELILRPLLEEPTNSMAVPGQTTKKRKRTKLVDHVALEAALQATGARIRAGDGPEFEEMHEVFAFSSLEGDRLATPREGDAGLDFLQGTIGHEDTYPYYLHRSGSDDGEDEDAQELSVLVTHGCASLGYAMYDQDELEEL